MTSLIHSYVNDVLLKAGLNSVLDSPLLEDERLIHLSYRDLIGDPVAKMKSIYPRLGLTFSAEVERRMRAWLSDPANKSDRYGRMSYSLSDFGTDEQTIHKRLSAYRQRFRLA